LAVFGGERNLEGDGAVVGDGLVTLRDVIRMRLPIDLDTILFPPNQRHSFRLRAEEGRGDLRPMNLLELKIVISG
jgi:hypothetical protein